MTPRLSRPEKSRTRSERGEKISTRHVGAGAKRIAVFPFVPTQVTSSSRGGW
jgi:hypothetical protein